MKMMGRMSKLSRGGYSWCECAHCSPDMRGQRSKEKREWIRDQLAEDMDWSRGELVD